MSIKATLVKAKEIIVERGVNRDGAWVNEKTGCEVCAFGAVYLALGAEVRRETAEGYGPYFRIDTSTVGLPTEARRALEQALPDDEESLQNRWVPIFNDNSKTDQEVFDLFDRAIANAED